VVAIPIAAGILYPIGILLSPAIGALAMSASSITVATNAVLLKRVEPQLRTAAEGATPPITSGTATPQMV
jgi:Cu2+-exporting ATPase